MLVSLLQPAYSLLPVIGIFLCTVICIADQETASASFVIFNHLAVALGLFQYPVLDFLTFILYFRTYYIFVAMRLKFRYIGIVHVSGSVKRAGVYQLEKDKRIIDAIDKAGGLLEDADSDAINLAEKIKDGMKIYVPKKGEKPTAGADLKSQSYIDLNLATKEELMTLPGVGEKTADKIIAYREAQTFEKVDDLLKVSGFGKKKMESLKGLISVGGEIYE